MLREHGGVAEANVKLVTEGARSSLSLEEHLASHSMASGDALSFGDRFSHGNVPNLHPIRMLTNPLYQQ